MAAPKISQYQFQGFTNQTAYNPLQLPDPSRLAESNISVIRDFFNQQEREGAKAFLEDDNYAKLAKFIPTLADTVLKSAEYAKEQATSYAEEQFYKNDEARRNALTKYEQEIQQPGDAVHEQETDMANQAMEQGGDITHLDFLQNLSGHAYRKYSELYLNSLGTQYGNFIEQELISNEDVIPLPGGDVKVNDRHTPQMRDVVVSYLRQKFFTQNGVPLAHPGAKAKYLYPHIDKADASSRSAFVKQYTIERGQEIRDENAYRLENYDLLGYVSATKNTVNDKGQRLGNVGSLEDAAEYYKSKAAAGEYVDLNQIGDLVIRDKKRTGKEEVKLRDWNKKWFNNLVADVRKARNTATAADYTDKQNEVKAMRDKLTRVPRGEHTIAYFDRAIKELTEFKQLTAPWMSDADAGIEQLKDMKYNHSISGVALDDLREDLDQRIQSQTASLDHPYFMTELGRQDAERIKQVEGMAVNQEDDIGVARKEVTEFLSETTKIARNVDGSLASTLVSFEADWQKKVEEYYRDYRRDLPPAEARNRAVAQVKQEWNTEYNDPNSRYYKGTEGTPTFPNYYKNRLAGDKGFQEDVRWHTNHTAALLEKPGGFKAQIVEHPYFIGKPEEIQSYVDYYDKYGRAPDFAVALTDELNRRAGKIVVRHPMELIFPAHYGYGQSKEIRQFSRLAEGSNTISPAGMRIFDDLARGIRPNVESQLRTVRTQPRGIFRTPSGRQVELPTVESQPNAQQRTIQFAQALLDKNNTLIPGVSLKPWQHSKFNVNTGYTEAGGQRVMRRNYDSLHHHDQALDYPLSHNSKADIEKLYTFLNANKKRLGITQLLWNVKGHYDHLHVGFE